MRCQAVKPDGRCVNEATHKYPYKSLSGEELFWDLCDECYHLLKKKRKAWRESREEAPKKKFFRYKVDEE